MYGCRDYQLLKLKDISDSSKDFIKFCILAASCLVGSKLNSDVANVGTGYVNVTDCQNISGFDMDEESNTIQVWFEDIQFDH